MAMIALLAVVGAMGGFVKSALSHNGKIIMPKAYEKGIILGSGLDVGLGGVIGALTAEPALHNLFHLSEPSVVLAFMAGFSALVVIETLGAKFGLLEKLNGTLNPSAKAGRKRKGRGSNPFPILLIPVVS